MSSSWLATTPTPRLWRAVRVAGLLVLAGSAPVCAAESAVLKLPMRIGSASSSLTVGQFLACLEHGPIPLKLSDLSDDGGGRYLARLDNDLEQYNIRLKQTNNAVRLVRLDRDNGPPLTAPDDLHRFVSRACRQARMGK